MTAATVAERIRTVEVEHREHRLGLLRTLAVVLCVVVVLTVATTEPGLGPSGTPLALAVAVLVFCAAALRQLRRGVPSLRETGGGARALRERPEVVLLAVAGVAIVALQPEGAAVAPAAAVWTLVSVVPGTLGGLLAGGVTLATGGAELAGGVAAGDAASTMLLCAVLGISGLFMRRASDGALETRILLVELEAARAREAEAAATAERARIAGELHDVLAHALSGAALQLEGARVVAGRDGASPRLRDAVGRAGDLVKAGLADARDAVGALRGDALPGLADLPALVTSASRDLDVDVTLASVGSSRAARSDPTLGAGEPSADAQLALYRGVQEALVNAARHAPGATVTVHVDRDDDHVRVDVTDTGGADAPPSPGGGHGLTGMQERLARAGGRAEAGPQAGGWRVRLEVPA